MNIALTGPESSGKTFLSGYLKEQFRGTLVHEYAREYLEKNSSTYTYEDFEKMAHGQWQIMNDSTSNNRLTIFDTEMLVYYVWSKVKYDKVEPWLFEMVKIQPVDHYLLCYPDLNWVFDELREYPDEKDRVNLFNMYEQLLQSFDYSYSIVKGDEQQRVSVCESLVRKFLLEHGS